MCLGPGCGFTMGYLTGMHRYTYWTCSNPPMNVKKEFASLMTTSTILLHRHLRECPMAGMMQEPKLEEKDIEYEHYAEPEVIVEEVEPLKEPEDIQQNYISQGEDT